MLCSLCMLNKPILSPVSKFGLEKYLMNVHAESVFRLNPPVRLQPSSNTLNTLNITMWEMLFCPKRDYYCLIFYKINKLLTLTLRLIGLSDRGV